MFRMKRRVRRNCELCEFSFPVVCIVCASQIVLKVLVTCRNYRTTVPVPVHPCFFFFSLIFLYIFVKIFVGVFFEQKIVPFHPWWIRESSVVCGWISATTGNDESSWTTYLNQWLVPGPSVKTCFHRSIDWSRSLHHARQQHPTIDADLHHIAPPDREDDPRLPVDQHHRWVTTAETVFL